jgi:hypothetical protein
VTKKQAVIGGLPPFNRSPITTQLVSVLGAAQPGQTLSYDEISASMSMTKADWFKFKESAYRILLEQGKAFRTVPKVGCEHVADDQLHTMGQRFVNRVHKMAKTAGKQVTQGMKDYDAMSNDAKVKFSTIAAHLGFLRAASAPAAVRAIEGATRVANHQLPPRLVADEVRDSI